VIKRYLFRSAAMLFDDRVGFKLLGDLLDTHCSRGIFAF